MTVFDPAIELQKLRDHLASGDRPIAFLFGAGTSAAINATDGRPLIPAVAELTRRCETAVAELGAPFDGAWAKLAALRNGTHPNIEDILSSVRQMRAAVLPGDVLVGLTVLQLQRMEDALQRAIAAEVRPSAARIPTDLPHGAMGRWLARVDRTPCVEIFTTNYDTMIERGLEQEGVHVFDGFVGAHRPFFSAASLTRDTFAPARRWTRLWKVHGSVTWTVDPNHSTGQRIIRGGEDETGELILPSLLKYDESRKQPYAAMIDRFRRVLVERDDVSLITSGYSFGDQHLNEVIFDALAQNPRLHVFALCFDDPAPDSELGRAVKRHSNLLVFGRTQASVGTITGSWNVRDPRRMEGRLQGMFTSDGAKDADPIATGPGSLHLGDFNKLCALLDGIVGTRE